MDTILALAPPAPNSRFRNSSFNGEPAEKSACRNISSILSIVMAPSQHFNTGIPPSPAPDFFVLISVVIGFCPAA